MGLNQRLLLAGALCLAGACTSKVEEKPAATPAPATPAPVNGTPAPQPTPKPPEAAPIPITEEPSFEREAGELPGLFQGALCVASGPTSTEEEKSFTEAFLSEFYKGGFKEAGDSSAEFFEESHKEAEVAPDFVVRVEYKTETVKEALEGRPHVDQLIKSVATVELAGDRSRGSKKFRVRLEHDQPTTQAREGAMRPAHASVTGRLLAQKLLKTLSEARGPAVRFEYSLVFKGYDRLEAREILEIVSSLPGVDPEDLSQRSAGAGLVVLMLSSEQAKATLSQAISEKLEGEDLEAEYGTPEPSTLFFTRKN